MFLHYILICFMKMHYVNVIILVLCIILILFETENHMDSTQSDKMLYYIINILITIY